MYILLNVYNKITFKINLFNMFDVRLFTHKSCIYYYYLTNTY